jgi:hypothetical protein
LGYLSNRFGKVQEYLVASGITELFNKLNFSKQGCHFLDVARNRVLYDTNDKKITEIDIMLENDNYILIVETKVTPEESDINSHLERLSKVYEYFKVRYSYEKIVIGAIAGTVFTDRVKEIAIQKGLFVISPSGNSFKIDVPENFQPKIFGSIANKV